MKCEASQRNIWKSLIKTLIVFNDAFSVSECLQVIAYLKNRKWKNVKSYAFVSKIEHKIVKLGG